MLIVGLSITNVLGSKNRAFQLSLQSPHDVGKITKCFRVRAFWNPDNSITKVLWHLHPLCCVVGSCVRYIVSDCDSVQVMHESTNYATTPEDAAADALNAGE